MTKTTKLLVGAGVALAALAGAFAMYSASPAASALDAVTHGTWTVSKTFAGPSANIQGLVTQQKGQASKAIVWFVDNKFLFAGTLYDSKGTDLTRKAAEQQGLVAKAEPSKELAAQALRATGFTLGSAGVQILAFEDPNCLFCHKFSQASQPLIAQGKLQVRVIPVGFLKGPDSLGKAAAILQSSNPAAAWEANMQGFDEKKEEGAATPVAVQKGSDMQRKLDLNLALLEQSGQVATPTLVVCAKGQKVPTVFHGLPQGQLGAMVPTLTTIQPDGSCAG